jgi:tetratricopeptide (TPR) repeat protein
MQTPANPKPAPAWLKTAAIAGFLIVGYGYFNYAMLPVAKSTAKIAQARRPIEFGEAYLAHSLLADATEDDPLSPDAPAMNGQLFLQRLYLPTMQQSEILNNAEQALFTAVQRNPEDYKNFDLLTDVFTFRARLQPQQKNQWLNKALYSAAIAVELYPGNAESHFRLAQVAEELDQPDTALEHYRKAIQIEDDFRKQFKLMYPGREVLSRMSNEKYLLAKKQVEALRK